MKDLILWTDIETNGLELDRHRILEVAMVLTDENLNELGAIERAIIPCKPALPDGGIVPGDVKYIQELYDDAVPFVQKMHTKNGLWEALKDGVPQWGARADFHAWLLTLLEKHGDGGKLRPLMGGASVHFDRKFMDKEFEQLMRLCHYRMFDVSSLKRMCEWWIPEDNTTPYDGLKQDNASNHRAMSDIRFTIAEAAAIRKEIDSRFWDFGKET